ncbi:hypothetical protein BH24BAC1_BH24BAC1_29810 [soil metagenome]
MARSKYSRYFRIFCFNFICGNTFHSVNSLNKSNTLTGNEGEKVLNTGKALLLNSLRPFI